MKQQRFWNAKRQCHIYLTISEIPGMFILMGKPWSSQALQALGIVQEPDLVAPSVQVLEFGDPSKFQGVFCRTQTKGSTPSWGGGGGSGGKVSKSPKS